MLIDRIMIKHLEKAARSSVDKVLSVYGHIVAGNPNNTKEKNLELTFSELFNRDYRERFPRESAILASEFEGICYLLAMASGTSGQAMLMRLAQLTVMVDQELWLRNILPCSKSKKEAIYEVLGLLDLYRSTPYLFS